MKTIAWISLLLLLGAFLARPISDPDIWWHINVGRWIMAHGEVPYVDYWNRFAVGTPWRAYSWSNELVYALADRLYGVVGLGMLQLFLAIFFALVAHVSFSFMAGSYFFGALLTTVSVAACRGHFSLRPQTTVWILFILALCSAEICKRRGPRAKYLIFTFILGVIWANSHLSAIIGAVTLFLWTLDSPNSRPKSLLSLKLAVAFLLGTLLTPYFGGEWMTLFSKSGHIFTFSAIDEFNPANITQASTAVVLFQIVVVLVLAFSSGRLPRMGAISVVVLTLLLGGITVKFLPFAALSLSALTALWVYEELALGKHDERNHLLRGLLQARNWTRSLQPQTLGACAFFISSLAFANSVKAINNPVAYSKTPRRAVDFFEEKSLSHPVLNEFESGGYMQYRWSSANGEPRALVAIDGRTNVNRPDIWSDYRNAFTGREEWRGYFDKVNPRTVIWRKGSPLTALLVEDPEWCRVFDAGSNPSGYGVFITRDEFMNRPGVFESSDCEIKGGSVYDAKATKSSGCKDLCGDGQCQEIVCMAVGCPCPESPASCPQDCK
jgi:hypothetical protein